MSGLTSATVCSGIGGWELATPGLRHAWAAETAGFPAAVLAARFPGLINHGDLEAIAAGETDVEQVDVLAAGTPCQSFSVAGLRRGLADPRGNLALAYLELARRLRPRWLVWENVPGVLSQDGGRAFGAVLGAMGELGYGWAYRILDAQYFGVPQRRRRVFVVGHLGAWQAAAAVLFEPAGLRRDTAPRRRAGAGVAGALTANAGSGVDDNDARGGRLVAYGGNDTRGELQAAPALSAHGGSHANAGGQAAVADGMRVRRLTPLECERLQGFPDGWTAVGYRGRPAADGPRYKALGNAFAVPVAAWIGRRLAALGGGDTPLFAPGEPAP